MKLSLSNLKPTVGSTKKRKVVGRGNASGHGTYSTRGGKGQKARTGGSKGLKLLGLRPMLLNLPKFKGFKSLKAAKQEVKISALDKDFSNGDTVNPAALAKKKLIKDDKKPVKILSNGSLSKNLTVENCFLSKEAKEKIIKAGGNVVEQENKE